MKTHVEFFWKQQMRDITIYIREKEVSDRTVYEVYAEKEGYPMMFLYGLPMDDTTSRVAMFKIAWKYIKDKETRFFL